MLTVKQLLVLFETRNPEAEVQLWDWAGYGSHVRGLDLTLGNFTGDVYNKPVQLLLSEWVEGPAKRLFLIQDEYGLTAREEYLTAAQENVARMVAQALGGDVVMVPDDYEEED